VEHKIFALKVGGYPTMGKQKNWKKILIYSALIASIAGALITGIINLIRDEIASRESERLMSEERKIREVIEREAILVLDGRIDEVVMLFDETAFVRDALSQTTWYGKDAIAERYRNLPNFSFLKHVAIEITFSTDMTYARAFSDTAGSFEANSAMVDVTTQGEKWTFKKIDNEWKIVGFTCNIP